MDEYKTNCIYRKKIFIMQIVFFDDIKDVKEVS